MDDVRVAARLFDTLFRAGAGTTDAPPRFDLARAEHRRAMHRWLNAWGCRIRYPQPGETDHLGAVLKAWWRRRRGLASIDRPLAQLTDGDIGELAAAFEELARSTVAVSATGGARTMGSTAAAKCLHALLPRSVMPWDQAIAEELHGSRDGDAFARHLALGRGWALALLDASGRTEADLLAHLDRSGSSLARVLDEWCYVRFTLGR